MSVALHLWSPGFLRGAERTVHADLAAAVASLPPLRGGHFAVVVVAEAEEHHAGNGVRVVQRPREWDVGNARIFASARAGGNAWPGAVETDLGPGPVRWALPAPGGADLEGLAPANPRRRVLLPAEPVPDAVVEPEVRRTREYEVRPLPEGHWAASGPPETDPLPLPEPPRRGRKPSVPDLDPDEAVLPPGLMPRGKERYPLDRMRFPKAVQERMMALGLKSLADLATVKVRDFSAGGPRGQRDLSRLAREKIAPVLKTAPVRAPSRKGLLSPEGKAFLAMPPERRAEAVRNIRWHDGITLSDILVDADGDGVLGRIANLDGKTLSLSEVADGLGLPAGDLVRRAVAQLRATEEAQGWPRRLLRVLDAEVEALGESTLASHARQGDITVAWYGLSNLVECLADAFPEFRLTLMRNRMAVGRLPAGIPAADDDAIPYDGLLDHVEPVHIDDDRPARPGAPAPGEPSPGDASAHPAPDGFSPDVPADAPVGGGPAVEGDIRAVIPHAPVPVIVQDGPAGACDDDAPAHRPDDDVDRGPAAEVSATVAQPPTLLSTLVVQRAEWRPLPGHRPASADVVFADWPGDGVGGEQLLCSTRETLRRNGSAFLLLGEFRWGGPMGQLDAALARSGLVVSNTVTWAPTVPPGNGDHVRRIEEGRKAVTNRLRRACYVLLHLTRQDAEPVILNDPDSACTQIQGAVSNKMGDLWYVYSDGKRVPSALYAMCMAAVGVPNHASVVDATGTGGPALASAASDLSCRVTVPGESAHAALETDAA